jgi:hypothetical protein
VEVCVRGLVVPDLLVGLLASQRWRHPGDGVLGEAMRWFEDPLIFLSIVDHMRRESGALDLFAEDFALSDLFREVRGSVWGHPVELAWLDVERAFFIAVNRMPGDDVAIALDYRTDPADPRGAPATSGQIRGGVRGGSSRRRSRPSCQRWVC